MGIPASRSELRERYEGLCKAKCLSPTPCLANGGGHHGLIYKFEDEYGWTQRTSSIPLSTICLRKRPWPYAGHPVTGFPNHPPVHGNGDHLGSAEPEVWMCLSYQVTDRQPVDADGGIRPTAGDANLEALAYCLRYSIRRFC